MADSKRILVIDDDLDFLNYVQIVLTARGYAVDTAHNATDGLSKMRELLPDLVIADVMMSYVLDGWSIIREMRADAALSHIPVIMVSAIVSMKDEGLFPIDEAGTAECFMSKPLEPAALLGCVGKLLGQ